MESSFQPPCSLIRLGSAPLQVEVLCWLAISGKVSTVDNLKRKGLSLEAISDLRLWGG